MFYAMISKDGVEYAAFDTEVEAATWICDELGSDYADDFWVENGKLARSGRMLDFGATVYPSLEEAVIGAARLDPGSAVTVLRALCDAIEASEGA